MPRVSVGKSGPIRAHCASENQKKSDISIASSLETMNHASPALGIPLMGPDPRIRIMFTSFMRRHFNSPVMKSLIDQSVSGPTMITGIAGLPSMFATMAIAMAASN